LYRGECGDITQFFQKSGSHLRTPLIVEAIFSLDGGNEKQAVYDINYIIMWEGYFEKTKISFLDYSHRPSYAGSRIEQSG
jgi:hypothetical protein